MGNLKEFCLGETTVQGTCPSPPTPLAQNPKDKVSKYQFCHSPVIFISVIAFNGNYLPLKAAGTYCLSVAERKASGRETTGGRGANLTLSQGSWGKILGGQFHTHTPAISPSVGSIISPFEVNASGQKSLPKMNSNTNTKVNATVMLHPWLFPLEEQWSRHSDIFPPTAGICALCT